MMDAFFFRDHRFLRNSHLSKENTIGKFIGNRISPRRHPYYLWNFRKLLMTKRSICRQNFHMIRFTAFPDIQLNSDIRDASLFPLFSLRSTLTCKLAELIAAHIPHGISLVLGLNQVSRKTDKRI